MLKQLLRKKQPATVPALISCECSKLVIYKEDCHDLAILTLLERDLVKA